MRSALGRLALCFCWLGLGDELAVAVPPSPRGRRLEDGSDANATETSTLHFSRWAATPFEPLFCATNTCGARESRNRTVRCESTTLVVSETVVFGRVVAVDTEATRATIADVHCERAVGEKPRETAPCPRSARGDPCDDDNRETMDESCGGDVCSGGTVALVSAVTFTIDTSDIAVPAEDEVVDASALAGAVKSSLTAALARAEVMASGTITVLSLSAARRRRLDEQGQAAGTLEVGFRVDVPPPQAVKTAGFRAVGDATLTLPSGQSSTAAVAQEFRSFAFQRSRGWASECPSTACSSECFAVETIIVVSTALGSVATLFL